MTFSMGSAPPQNQPSPGPCVLQAQAQARGEVGLLVALTSQQHASVSQGRICSENFTCCHTEIELADPTSHISPSHSILIPDRPVPALTLYRQAPGRVLTGVPIFKSLVSLDPEKIPAQAGFEPGIFRSRGGRLNH